MRRFWCWMLIGLLVGMNVLPSIGWAQEGAAQRQGRVLATTLNVRSGPGTTYAVVASVASGDVVRITGEQDDWYQVRLADGAEGWVAKRFLELMAPAPASAPAEQPAEATPAPAAPKETRTIQWGEEDGGGGSVLGTVFKWGCFLGAGACAYLAYDQKTQGDDAYDEYKADVEERGIDPQVAEPKRQDAIDHDGKAQTFGIVAGALFGAFVVQQFFLGGDDDDFSAREAESHMPLAFNPRTGEIRASVVLARF